MQIHNESSWRLEMLQIKRLPARQRAFYRWSAGLIFGLIGAVLGSLISGPFDAVFGGLVSGLLGMLIEKIEPVEAFIWSWRRTRSVLLSWTLVGLFIGLSGGLIYELAIGLSVSLNLGLFFGLVYWFLIGLPDGLRFGLLGGLSGGLAASVIYGFTSKRLAERFTFFLNEGMHRSTKNGLAGALLGALVGIPFSILFWNSTFVLLGMLGGGLICGLGAVIQYIIMSFWLWRSLKTQAK